MIDYPTQATDAGYQSTAAEQATSAGRYYASLIARGLIPPPKPTDRRPSRDSKPTKAKTPDVVDFNRRVDRLMEVTGIQYDSHLTKALGLSHATISKGRRATVTPHVWQHIVNAERKHGITPGPIHDPKAGKMMRRTRTQYDPVQTIAALDWITEQIAIQGTTYGLCAKAARRFGVTKAVINHYRSNEDAESRLRATYGEDA